MGPRGYRLLLQFTYFTVPLLLLDGSIDKAERDLSAKFFAAFKYCLMELTPPSIEPEEEEAAFSPYWPRFLAMSREEMIAFLAAYVSQIEYIEP